MQAGLQFLKEYSVDDIYCIEIPGESTSTWQISPPSLKQLKDDLNNRIDLKIDISYFLTRFVSLSL